MGDLDYSTDADNMPYQDFNISKLIKHPNYTFISSYNDIALLKLDRPAVLNKFVQPACLQTQKDTDYNIGVLLVAGWGDTFHNSGRGSSQLRKAALEIVSEEYCSKVYPKDAGRLKKGIDDETQICAGSFDDEGNTCKVKIKTVVVDSIQNF